MRPFKGLKAQTIRLIGAKRSQSAAPEEKELFNNVYNSNPKAAELHQMLRWDGARRNPPGKMRSGTRSGFSTLTATKKGGGRGGARATKILIYLLGRNWTPEQAAGSGRLLADRQKANGPESCRF